MLKKILCTLLLTLLFISSCSSNKITYTPPPIEDNWSVQMIQTGGIAGVNRVVEVLSDGSYTVYQQMGGEAMKGQLTESELTQLKELIENLEISTSRTNSVCADCFEYNLEIETGGKKMIVNADDISIPDSGAGELVMFLQELIDFELK